MVKACGVNQPYLGEGDLGDFPNPGPVSSMSARQVFGGIEVSWTYPLTNPTAVAHFEVVRSTTNDVNTASLVRLEDASAFVDRPLPPAATEYYYWVRTVGISGLIGEWVGPVNATALPLTSHLIGQLLDSIGVNHLTADVRNQLLQIQQLATELEQETAARQADFTALSQAIQDANVQGVIDDLNQEILDRQAGDTQLLNALNAQIQRIDQEILDRGEADSDLLDAINTEIANRQAADQAHAADPDPHPQYKEVWIDTAPAVLTFTSETRDGIAGFSMGVVAK